MKSARNSILSTFIKNLQLNILVFSVNTNCLIKVDIYGVYRTTSMYRNQYQMITSENPFTGDVFHLHLRRNPHHEYHIRRDFVPV